MISNEEIIRKDCRIYLANDTVTMAPNEGAAIYFTQVGACCLFRRYLKTLFCQFLGSIHLAESGGAVCSRASAVIPLSHSAPLVMKVTPSDLSLAQSGVAFFFGAANSRPIGFAWQILTLLMKH